jgi:hypothetical protein
MKAVGMHIAFFKFGLIGRSPKCKMQNAKCKIGERKNEATQTGNQGFSFLG